MLWDNPRRTPCSSTLVLVPPVIHIYNTGELQTPAFSCVEVVLPLAAVVGFTLLFPL